MAKQVVQITKSISIGQYGECSPLTYQCTGQGVVSGDTDFVSSYDISNGSKECCSSTSTVCLAVDNCPYTFSNVVWKSSYTTGGITYTLKTSSGATAVYTYETEIEGDTYYTLTVIHTGEISDTETYTLKENTLIQPYSYKKDYSGLVSYSPYSNFYLTSNTTITITYTKQYTITVNYYKDGTYVESSYLTYTSGAICNPNEIGKSYTGYIRDSNSPSSSFTVSKDVTVYIYYVSVYTLTVLDYRDGTLYSTIGTYSFKKGTIIDATSYIDTPSGYKYAGAIPSENFTLNSDTTLSILYTTERTVASPSISVSSRTENSITFTVHNNTSYSGTIIVSNSYGDSGSTSVSAYTITTITLDCDTNSGTASAYFKDDSDNTSSTNTVNYDEYTYTLTIKKNFYNAGGDTSSTSTEEITIGTEVNPNDYVEDLSDYYLMDYSPTSSFTINSDRTITINYWDKSRKVVLICKVQHRDNSSLDYEEEKEYEYGTYVDLDVLGSSLTPSGYIYEFATTDSEWKTTKTGITMNRDQEIRFVYKESSKVALLVSITQNNTYVGSSPYIYELEQGTVVDLDYYRTEAIRQVGSSNLEGWEYDGETSGWTVASNPNVRNKTTSFTLTETSYIYYNYIKEGQDKLIAPVVSITRTSETNIEVVVENKNEVPVVLTYVSTYNTPKGTMSINESSKTTFNYEVNKDEGTFECGFSADSYTDSVETNTLYPAYGGKYNLTINYLVDGKLYGEPITTSTNDSDKFSSIVKAFNNYNKEFVAETTTTYEKRDQIIFNVLSSIDDSVIAINQEPYYKKYKIITITSYSQDYEGSSITKESDTNITINLNYITSTSNEEKYVETIDENSLHIGSKSYDGYYFEYYSNNKDGSNDLGNEEEILLRPTNGWVERGSINAYAIYKEKSKLSNPVVNGVEWGIDSETGYRYYNLDVSNNNEVKVNVKLTYFTKGSSSYSYDFVIKANTSNYIYELRDVPAVFSNGTIQFNSSETKYDNSNVVNFEVGESSQKVKLTLRRVDKTTSNVIDDYKIIEVPIYSEFTKSDNIPPNPNNYAYDSYLGEDTINVGYVNQNIIYYYNRSSSNLTIEFSEEYESENKYTRDITIKSKVDYSGNIYYRYKLVPYLTSDTISFSEIASATAENNKITFTKSNTQNFKIELVVEASLKEDMSDTISEKTTLKGTDWLKDYVLTGSTNISYISKDSSYVGKAKGVVNTGVAESEVYLTFTASEDGVKPNNFTRLTLTDNTESFEDEELTKSTYTSSGFAGGNFSLSGGLIYVYSSGYHLIGSYKYTASENSINAPSISKETLTNTSIKWVIENTNEEDLTLYYRVAWNSTFTNIDYISQTLKSGEKKKIPVVNDEEEGKTSYIQAYFISEDDLKSSTTNSNYYISGNVAEDIKPTISLTASENKAYLILGNSNDTEKTIYYRYNINSQWTDWLFVSNVDAGKNSDTITITNNIASETLLTVQAYIGNSETTSKDITLSGVEESDKLVINYYYNNILNNTKTITMAKGTQVNSIDYIEQLSGLLFEKIEPEGMFIFIGNEKIDIYYSLIETTEPIDKKLTLTRWITADDFYRFTGIDLSLNLRGEDNESNKVEIFLSRIEIDVETYLNGEFGRKINFSKLSSYQQQQFKLGLLYQAEWEYNNGRLSKDSGYDPEKGIIAPHGKIEDIIISPQAKNCFKNCGLLSTHLRSSRYGIWW